MLEAADFSRSAGWGTAFEGGASGPSLRERLNVIVAKHPDLAKAASRSPHHLGTLGTGNHFIELCIDTDGAVWVMLHSGSRGIGNKIGTYFIERAKAEMRRWFVNLPDADLAYIPEGSELFDDYVEALTWAQDFARANREAMMRAVLGVIEQHFPGRVGRPDELAVNCHHN